MTWNENITLMVRKREQIYHRESLQFSINNASINMLIHNKFRSVFLDFITYRLLHSLVQLASKCIPLRHLSVQLMRLWGKSSMLSSHTDCVSAWHWHIVSLFIFVEIFFCCKGVNFRICFELSTFTCMTTTLNSFLF